MCIKILTVLNGVDGVEISRGLGEARARCKRNTAKCRTSIGFSALTGKAYSYAPVSSLQVQQTWPYRIPLLGACGGRHWVGVSNCSEPPQGPCMCLTTLWLNGGTPGSTQPRQLASPRLPSSPYLVLLYILPPLSNSLPRPG